MCTCNEPIYLYVYTLYRIGHRETTFRNARPLVCVYIHIGIYPYTHVQQQQQQLYCANLSRIMKQSARAFHSLQRLMISWSPERERVRESLSINVIPSRWAGKERKNVGFWRRRRVIVWSMCNSLYLLFSNCSRLVTRKILGRIFFSERWFLTDYTILHIFMFGNTISPLYSQLLTSRNDPRNNCINAQFSGWFFPRFYIYIYIPTQLQPYVYRYIILPAYTYNDFRSPRARASSACVYVKKKFKWTRVRLMKRNLHSITYLSSLYLNVQRVYTYGDSLRLSLIARLLWHRESFSGYIQLVFFFSLLKLRICILIFPRYYITQYYNYTTHRIYSNNSKHAHIHAQSRETVFIHTPRQLSIYVWFQLQNAINPRA